MKTPLLAAVLSLLALSPLSADEPLVRIAEPDARKAVLERVNPVYPPMAKQMRVTGKVQVDIFIDPEGAVEKVNTISGNPLLTAAATAAVKQWKFTPFKSNGKNIHAVTAMSFSFSL